MLVQVEVQYKATPPAEELETMREAGKTLASSQKSVSVHFREQSKFPTIVLEFQMKTQAEDEVVDKIFEIVERHMNKQIYSEMLVRFSKTPKRSPSKPVIQ